MDDIRRNFDKVYQTIKSLPLTIFNEEGNIPRSDNKENIVKLPVAGIMSPNDGYQAARQYQAIDQMAKDMGSTLESPYMTLSFMALLVIPSLKLSDKGLFEGNRFEFVDMCL